MRKNEKDAPHFDEITQLVEEVRAERHAKK